MTTKKKNSVTKRKGTRRKSKVFLQSNISDDGMKVMERAIEYLYHLRIATIEQLSRCLDGESADRLYYWLRRYQPIRKQTMSITRYDLTERKWIRAPRITVCTLP